MRIFNSAPAYTPTRIQKMSHGFSSAASTIGKTSGIKPLAFGRLGSSLVGLAVLGGLVEAGRRAFGHAQFFKAEAGTDKLLPHLGEGIGRTFKNLKDGMSAKLQEWFPGKGTKITETDGSGNKTTTVTKKSLEWDATSRRYQPKTSTEVVAND